MKTLQIYNLEWHKLKKNQKTKITRKYRLWKMINSTKKNQMKQITLKKFMKV